MTQTPDASLVREAVAAAKEGNKMVARQLLREACEQNPQNEQAWLWRASLCESSVEAKSFLYQVLRINPHNEKAAAWLRRFEPQADSAAKPASQVVISSVPTPQALKQEPPPVAAVVVPAPVVAAPLVASRWRCPFCRYPSERDQMKCPGCKAVVVFRDLKEIESNEGVQERLLREAIGHLEALDARQQDYDVQLQLALAHLNLGEVGAAIPHLKAACGLRPNNWTLLAELDVLLRRRMVLVVDDSATVRKAVSLALERNELRVLTAEDGLQALAQLKVTVPSVILLDINMPMMDGYQVCKMIKENPATKKVPVVMLSGRDGVFDKVRGRLAGASDYITKPFQTKTLLKTVRGHLPSGAFRLTTQSRA